MRWGWSPNPDLAWHWVLTTTTYRSLQAASGLLRQIFNYFGKMMFVTSKMNFFKSIFLKNKILISSTFIQNDVHFSWPLYTVCIKDWWLLLHLAFPNVHLTSLVSLGGESYWQVWLWVEKVRGYGEA